MNADANDSGNVIERLGIESDAAVFKELSAIQAELAIAFDLIAAGIRESDSGFLISAYKPEDFKKFIQLGGIILGARQSVNGRLAGYLLGNSGQTFLANHPDTQLRWDTPEQKAQYGQNFESGRFTYLDQIGVARVLHGTGIARKLHQHFLAFAERPILAAIVQEPLRNKRSIEFFLRLGYRQIGTFYTAEFKGLQDVVSAVLALPEDIPSP